ncbi:MAG TPA: hypothetical protein VLA92_02285 [Candidatus Saccharimonadales bacterium]|nr:hypothetical protein [Candidatus Saccharimonadales bacterium]
MELSTVQQIILIILASSLAIFLILSVAIAVMVLRLVKTIRVIVEKAERIVESAEAVGDVFKRAAGPMSILRFIQGVMDHKRANDK